ncbi:MAG: glycosyl transferase family 2 [Chryseobacterium sp.]|nr:MAG: glycosyl transferase family 2 [Chryseobacterium sp.]
MDMNKKISVYIPTKNRLNLLREAIDSVVNQTYTNWELIVVNDGSDDATQEYMDELSKNNPNIKSIYHKESKGACISRNEAIFSATGDFITGLDDDDTFKADRLQKFIDNWDENAGFIALSAYFDVNTNGLISEKKNIEELIITQSDLLYENLVGNQAFVKTEDLRRIGGFDSDFKMWQDLDCWYRLLGKNNKIRKIPFSTYIWDNDDRSDRISNKSKQKVADTYKLFIKKHQLNTVQSNVLKIVAAEYNAANHNLYFYVKLIFKTNFDKKIINLTKSKFKAEMYQLLVKFKLIQN